jgi:hypothetical protein
MFVHCVYFWLRDDLTPDELKAFVDGVNSLTTCESVRQGYVGVPAPTDRPIIDRSYSYALVVTFDDEAAHDVYQEDPIHDAFRQNCAQYWKTVKIYDFVTA